MKLSADLKSRLEIAEDEIEWLKGADLANRLESAESSIETLQGEVTSIQDEIHEN